MITLRPAALADIEDIALLHRHTRLACFSFLAKPHDHTHADDLRFFSEHIFARGPVTVACEHDRIIGYAATTLGWLEHLYVHPDWHGRGVGHALLHWARSEQDEMRLWVFQANTQARRFYERQGFTCEALHDGSNNMEREPDAVYVWHRQTFAP